jgi:CheY-like chemotaxis protein
VRTTVLVVDDDDDMAEALSFVLRRAGHRVATARNGAEALARLGEVASSICVILLDLMMPVMDGWQFRTAQLRSPALASIPVVVLSGRVDVLKDGAAVLAADYIRKPIHLETLLAIIERYCGSPAGAGPAPVGLP